LNLFSLSKQFFLSPRRWTLLAIGLSGLVLSGCSAAISYSWPEMAISGEVVAVTTGNSVVALNPSTGVEIWKFDSKSVPADQNTANRNASLFYSPLAIEENKIGVASYHQHFFVLTNDGKYQWSFDMAPSKNATVVNAVTFGDGASYAVNEHELVAVSAEGSELWRKSAINTLWSAPLVDGDRLYQPSNDHFLYAWKTADGSDIWKTELGGSLVATPTLTDGVLYIGSMSNHVYALSAQDGSILWDFATVGWVWSSPTVRDGVAYFGDLKGNLYAVDATNGTERWRMSVDSAVRGAPALTNNLVIINSEKGFVYAFAIEDGLKQWQVEVDASIKEKLLSTPLLVNDLVLIAAVDGKQTVYAYNSANGTAQWTYPAK
jgi:outer membrane protein assembly factor BamB